MHANKNCCDLNGSVVLFLNMIKLKELDSLGLYHITYLQTENSKKKIKSSHYTIQREDEKIYAEK